MAKGKTDRCHNQMGTHPAYQCEILHSLRGWSETMLGLRYPNWLRAHVVAAHMTLIFDQFDDHDDHLVHKRAGKLKIGLIFIPWGGTIGKGRAENQFGWTSSNLGLRQIQNNLKNQNAGLGDSGDLGDGSGSASCV
jgi:hypothetical protein